MDIKFTSINGVETAIINIVGNCAVKEVEVLRKELLAIYDKRIFNIIFDFEACEFIDSTGLGMLVSVHKRCVENKGMLTVKRPSEVVSKLLRMTRLDHVFEIV